MKKGAISIFNCCILILITVSIYNCDSKPGNNKSSELSDLQKADAFKKQDSVSKALFFYKKAANQTSITENSNEWWRCLSGIIDCKTDSKNYSCALAIIDSLQVLISPKNDTSGNLNAALLYKEASIYADQRL